MILPNPLVTTTHILYQGDRPLCHGLIMCACQLAQLPLETFLSGKFPS